MKSNEEAVLKIIHTALLRAVRGCLTIVRQGQVGRHGKVEFKPDTTIVTPTDKLSDRTGKEILRTNLRDLIKSGIVMIHGEESGVEGRSGCYTVYLDGLDGSKPFAVGASTSTVIAACYDNKINQVVQCVVGEASTGRVWFTIDDRVKLTWSDGETVDLSVYSGDAKEKNVVFIDSYSGFKRGDRTIFDQRELNTLHELLFKESNPLMLGSNGIHHALVANGANLATGAITTAIGGPWDVCPVLLVIKAGGFARAFAVTASGKLEMREPLNVTSYDILITAGSSNVLDRLTEIVKLVKGTPKKS